MTNGLGIDPDFGEDAYHALVLVLLTKPRNVFKPVSFFAAGIRRLVTHLYHRATEPLSMEPADTKKNLAEWAKR